MTTATTRRRQCGGPKMARHTAAVLAVVTSGGGATFAGAWIPRAPSISHRPLVMLPPLRDAVRSMDSPRNSSGSSRSATLRDVDVWWDAAVDSRSSSSNPPYRSTLLTEIDQWEAFVSALQQRVETEKAQANAVSCSADDRKQLALWANNIDPFWEQIKLEAETALLLEPQAGPQLYQGILSQPSLLSAICTVVSHEIETELIPATALKNLFMDLLTPDDVHCIRQDLQAVSSRSPSIEHAMETILFHNGFHALVCYRVGHRLWQKGRTGLAYYMQSTVSRKYSADIHPACVMGAGIYVRVGAGVVIGETAVIGNDVSILEGVTLGGTGKEAGDRHPKVGNGVILQDGGTVLGNIPVGEGAVVTAKSIVTKPVPPLAIVSGVPAKIQNYRDLHESSFDDDLERHLVVKYLDRWRALYDQLYSSRSS